MNIILSERAFREKLYRTKIKVLQNKIDNKIEYFGALMEEEIKEEKMDQLRDRVRAERHQQMKKTMAILNIKGDGPKSPGRTSRTKKSKSKGKTKRSQKSIDVSKKDSSKLNVMFN